jgi:hypothetical protein
LFYVLKRIWEWKEAVAQLGFPPFVVLFQGLSQPVPLVFLFTFMDFKRVSLLPSWIRIPFSHGFAFQFDFVRDMDQPVEDGVGQGGIADGFAPMRDRNLSGNKGRMFTATIFQQFQTITARFIVHGIQIPIVH